MPTGPPKLEPGHRCASVWQQPPSGNDASTPTPATSRAPRDQSATQQPGPYQHFGKRTVDLLVGATLTLLAAPLLGAVWVLLRLALGPDVILKQERVGQGRSAFGLYKFRTMKLDRRDEAEAQPFGFGGDDRRGGHKSPDDPRHTPVGRIVRRFSLDELPQLVNICKGDMSLVGPRPELMAVASSDFLAHPRHDVRPGLTGPYQVSDLRYEGDLNAGLAMDAEYVGNVTALGDLRYLFATVGVLLRGTGS